MATSDVCCRARRHAEMSARRWSMLAGVSMAVLVEPFGQSVTLTGGRPMRTARMLRVCAVPRARPLAGAGCVAELCWCGEVLLHMCGEPVRGLRGLRALRWSPAVTAGGITACEP